MSRLLLPALLLVAVLVSAIAVVVTKHGNRELVAEIDRLQRQREALRTERSQLVLEEAALAHPGRVEQLARERLGMHEPRRVMTVEAAD